MGDRIPAKELTKKQKTHLAYLNNLENAIFKILDPIKTKDSDIARMHIQTGIMWAMRAVCHNKKNEDDLKIEEKEIKPKVKLVLKNK